jgi:aminopeptidase N
VDFKSVLGKIAVDPIEQNVSGDVQYNLKFESTDTAPDAKIWFFQHKKLDNAEGNAITSKGNCKLFFHSKGKTLTFLIFCQARANYILINPNKKRKFANLTQGQGKAYNSHWFPSFDDVLFF